MYVIKALILIFFMLFVVSCNKNLTEEEKKELWSKAQKTGEIYKRSGSKMPNSTDAQKERAMQDARTRLTTGGGLFGKGGLDVMGVINNNEGGNFSGGVGLPINPYLWEASLETVNFMPLSSTDPMGGVIITDWYTSINNLNERCKLNIFINGADLKTDNLKVASFCQIKKKEQWVNLEPNLDDNIKLENTILNKAKKLKLKSG